MKGIKIFVSFLVLAVVAIGAAGQAPSAPVPTVNEAAYNAKMLALANRRPQTHCLPPGAVATPVDPPAEPIGAPSKHKPHRKKVAPLRPCPKPLWPVHAAYPDAGALLPFHRIVAYYGNFYSTQMGILGQYPPADVLTKLQTVVNAWTEADPATPVIPALDYIAVSAQASRGPDGDYRLRMPAAQIEKAIHMADQAHGLVFLDVQPGWSSLQQELPRLEPYMKLPNVELAIDPEFALVHGHRPGVWRGTLSGSDIDFAVRWLANIVEQNHLPPKVLVVHRFTQAMVTDYRAIKPRPQVEVVMDMDGFGSPSDKKAAYRDFIEHQPVQFTGFKLFYHNDMKWGHHLMTPAEILALSPRPIYIVYQ
ncbi:MAG: hypothetical protein EPN33_05805 [Acidobacteria bacterium]|nr:MAG: hypothetical protein EPN33_05805 [Acidobacteriota bacterium]